MSTPSTRSRWYRPPRAVVRLRFWRLCSEWLNASPAARWLYAAERPATTADIPEERVERVLGPPSRKLAADAS